MTWTFVALYFPVLSLLFLEGWVVFKLCERVNGLEHGSVDRDEAEDDARFMQELAEFSNAAERRLQDLKALSLITVAKPLAKSRMN